MLGPAARKRARMAPRPVGRCPKWQTSLAVAATFQSRTVIAAILLVIGTRLGPVRAAQGGPLLVRILDLVAVLDTSQAGLYLGKLRGVGDVLRLGRQQTGNFRLRLLNAIGRLGMGFKGLGQEARLFLLHGLH